MGPRPPNPRLARLGKDMAKKKNKPKPGWVWMEVRNNTGNPITIQWGSGYHPLIVPPGGWRFTW